MNEVKLPAQTGRGTGDMNQLRAAQIAGGALNPRVPDLQKEEKLFRDKL